MRWATSGGRPSPRTRTRGRRRRQRISLGARAERPDGRTLFAEKLLIEPARRPVRQTGVMGPFDVLGNVILLTPKAAADRIQARVAAEVDLVNGVASGACHLPNEAGLIFKAVGRETMQVKSKVREFWGIAREEITGKGCLRGGKVAACRRSRFASSIAICAA